MYMQPSWPPRPAVTIDPEAEMESEGYRECWNRYRNPYFAAKELTVLPGRTATIRDAAPYRVITVQRHGTRDAWPIETPTLIRFGQLTHDQYFVPAPAAQQGGRIANASQTEPLVMLKHCGPHAEAAGIEHTHAGWARTRCFRRESLERRYEMESPAA